MPTTPADRTGASVGCFPVRAAFPVSQAGHLPEAQAVLVVEMAQSQVRLFGGTENYVVTRQFKTLSSPQQRFRAARVRLRRDRGG